MMESDLTQYPKVGQQEKPIVATPSPPAAADEIFKESGSPTMSSLDDIPWEPPSVARVLLTSLSVTFGFAGFCFLISFLNRQAAILLAVPLYSVYPRTVASMVMGGISGTICILPFVVVVICFHWFLKINIRTPEDVENVSLRETFHIALMDARDAARLGIVLGPILVHLLDQPASDAFNASSGGQLAATFVHLRMFFVWKRELGRIFLGRDVEPERSESMGSPEKS